MHGLIAWAVKRIAPFKAHSPWTPMGQTMLTHILPRYILHELQELNYGHRHAPAGIGRIAMALQI